MEAARRARAGPHRLRESHRCGDVVVNLDVSFHRALTLRFGLMDR